jgi:hypothetical protein
MGWEFRLLLETKVLNVQCKQREVIIKISTGIAKQKLREKLGDTVKLARRFLGDVQEPICPTSAWRTVERLLSQWQKELFKKVLLV